MTQSIEETRSEFIEKIGVMAQTDGLPRIAGRMLGLFVWDVEAIAFGDLAEQLQVSRGSISTATRILEERRLIKRVAKPGDRQDYFQLAENPYAKMLDYYAETLGHTQAEITDTIEKIPADEAVIRARVTAYADFYKSMAAALTKISKDLDRT
ncbi:DNA-binding transcriptional regulator GbsR (MarR family) [Loktanella ponticola]|uniref:DNA-binding transcriptional regulator GbsR (MarR family) n=1 Tax=Yoonia ponticola TaxID=1524255 RepID=A0A7W9EWP2_9RHOB|nr:MarR family transcriptional regulator [Yoonia ponticola]MBB5720818.1 DNA-binding transcriptional regulator GbsR (MarR family) [Yoonia ponticola]